MKLNIVKQLRSIRDEKSRELNQLNLAIDALSPKKAPQSERRTMSLSARRRIAAAQKERWANWRRHGKPGKRAA